MNKKKIILIISLGGSAIFIGLIIALVLVFVILPKSNKEQNFELKEYDYVDAFEYSDNEIISTYMGINGIYDYIEIPKNYVKDGKTIEITSIGYLGFSQMGYARKLYIPETILKIDEMSTGNLYGLQEFIVSDNNPNYKSIDGVLYSKDGKTLIAYPRNKVTKEFIIPDSVEKICPYAFYEHSIEKIILHDNIIDFGSIKDLKGNNQDLIEYGNIYYLSTESNPYFLTYDFVDYRKETCIIHNSTKYVKFNIGFGSIEPIFEENNLNLSIKDGIVYSKDEKEIIYIPHNKVYDIFEISPYITRVDRSLTNAKINTLILNNNNNFGISSWIDKLILGEEFTNFADLPSTIGFEIELHNNDYIFENNMILSKDKSTLYKYFYTKYDEDIYIPKYVTTIKDGAINTSSQNKIYYEGNIDEWLRINIEDSISSDTVYLMNNNSQYYEYTDISIPDTITKINENNLKNINSLFSEILYIPNTVKNIIITMFSFEKIYYEGSYDELLDVIDNQVDFFYQNEIYVYENNEYKLALEIYISRKKTIENLILDKEIIDFTYFLNIEKVDNLYITRNVKEISLLPDNVYDFGIYDLWYENVYFDGTVEDWCKILIKDFISNPMNSTENFYFKNNQGQYVKIKDLIIMNGVEEIKSYQFYGPSFETITVGGSVKKIHSEAFIDCVNVTRISIKEGVQFILDMAFFNFDKLEYVFISSTVSFISEIFLADDWLMIGTPSIKRIDVDNNNKYYKSVDGNLYTKDGKILIHYAAGNSETTFIVPEGVEIISTFSFGRTNLESIIMPSSLKLIDSFAVSSTENITKVYMPQGTYIINDRAFDQCDVIFNNDSVVYGEFTTLTIQDIDKVSYYNRSFYSMNLIIESGEKFNLTGAFEELHLPKTIKNINQSFNVEKLYYYGTIEDWMKVNIKRNIYGTSLYLLDENNEFYLVTYIDIPQSFNEIGNHQFTFRSIKNVNLHDNVISIGDGAFYNTRITKIYIPKSVKFINDSFELSYDSYNRYVILYCEVDQIQDGWIINSSYVGLEFNKLREDLN